MVWQKVMDGSGLVEGRLGKIDIFVKSLNKKNYIEINIIDQKTIVLIYLFFYSVPLLMICKFFVHYLKKIKYFLI